MLKKKVILKASVMVFSTLKLQEPGQKEQQNKHYLKSWRGLTVQQCFYWYYKELELITVVF